MSATSFRLLLGLALALPATAGLASADAPDCPGKPAAEGVVAAILDGTSLKLENGTEIRLAGLEPPSPDRKDSDRRAVTALGAMVLGKRVEIRHAAAKPDRHGRINAQLFLAGPEPEWVQARLVAEGLSRVYPTADSRACAAALLPVERRARAARLGLWAEPAYEVRKAEDASLRHVEDVYAVVEGRIVSVGRSSATVYLNFGRNWSTDFTVTLPARAAAEFEAAGKGAAALKGREVRVRGWITQWNGASMRLGHPDEIELVGQESRNGD